MYSTGTTATPQNLNKKQSGGKTLQHNNQPFKPAQFTTTHQQ
jgi:hypothetical protein